MKIRSRALVALTTATLTLGLASPAHAAQNVRTDASNDVVRMSLESEGVPQPAPNANQGDIRRFVVDHRATNVLVTARFNDLVRGKQHHYHVLQLLTADVRNDVEIAVEPGGRAQGTTTYTNRAGRRVACAGLETNIDWSTNVLRVKIPRKCLGNPNWVRAGYGYFRITPKWDLFADEAYRNGAIGEEKPAFGPRVHRG